MPVNAIRIDPDGRASTVNVPDDSAALRSELRSSLGGVPNPAVYHRRSLL